MSKGGKALALLWFVRLSIVPDYDGCGGWRRGLASIIHVQLLPYFLLEQLACLPTFLNLSLRTIIWCGIFLFCCFSPLEVFMY